MDATLLTPKHIHEPKLQQKIHDLQRPKVLDTEQAQICDGFHFLLNVNFHFVDFWSLMFFNFLLVKL